MNFKKKVIHDISCKKYFLEWFKLENAWLQSSENMDLFDKNVKDFKHQIFYLRQLEIFTSPYVGGMLFHRLRRWPNVEPELGVCRVGAGYMNVVTGLKGLIPHLIWSRIEDLDTADIKRCPNVGLKL